MVKLKQHSEIPNSTTMEAINEVIADLKNPKLTAANSYEELERILNKKSK